MPLLSPQRRAQLVEYLWGLLTTLLFHLLRLLPPRTASDLGERLSRRIGPAHNPNSDRSAYESLRLIRPHDPESGRAEAVARMWGHVGRVQGEICVIDRMWDSAPITMVNEEAVRCVVAQHRPVVFVFAHLGNWELLAIAAVKLGLTLNVVYEMLPERYELELSMRARRGLGYRLIAPTRAGLRQMLAALGHGEAVGIAIDEFKRGNVVAPPFGRQSRPDSNARLASRLARRFDAPLIPACCVRTAPFAFTITVYDPLERPSAAELEALCESWIRAHPEQWYMLPRMRLGRSES
jgi:Kdo2-lipid IVA lauroyltransferase/acyltransferase